MVHSHPLPNRFVAECRLEPRCVPTGYGSTVLVHVDSTRRRYTEELRLQKCLLPAPEAPTPRRFRTELEMHLTPPITTASEWRDT